MFESEQEFRGTLGEFVYPRELLLGLILISVFDGGLSSREIKIKTCMDIAYMCLAAMENHHTGQYHDLKLNIWI